MSVTFFSEDIVMYSNLIILYVVTVTMESEELDELVVAAHFVDK